MKQKGLPDRKVRVFSPSDEPEEVEDFIYKVLYKHYGVPEEPHCNWDGKNEQGAVVVMYDGDGKLLGTVRLVYDEQNLDEAEIKKFAISPLAQGMGLGRSLTEYIEGLAIEKGIKKITLGAREPAYGFYEKMGYLYTSNVYESDLTHISHRNMEKILQEK